MDQFLVERNARRNRSLAITLAVGFHLAVGAAVYVGSSAEPTPAPTTPTVKTVAKTTAAPGTTPVRPMQHKRTDIP